MSMLSSNDRFVRLEELMPLILEQLSDGKTVTFAPRGISMLPMLRQGKDTVELAPLPARLRKYDLPLYQRSNGQYVLHRIIDVGESYTCVGDNQFELEKGLTHDQMIAVVKAFTRSGRKISVDAHGYRLYCRLWCLSRPLRRQLRRVRKLLGRIKRKLL